LGRRTARSFLSAGGLCLLTVKGPGRGRRRSRGFLRHREARNCRATAGGAVTQFTRSPLAGLVRAGSATASSMRFQMAPHPQHPSEQFMGTSCRDYIGSMSLHREIGRTPDVGFVDHQPRTTASAPPSCRCCETRLADRMLAHLRGIQRGIVTLYLPTSETRPQIRRPRGDLLFVSVEDALKL
jgi:hypothetical protein